MKFTDTPSSLTWAVSHMGCEPVHQDGRGFPGPQWQRLYDVIDAIMMQLIIEELDNALCTSTVTKQLSYSLFILRKARFPLRIIGERALLRMNRL